MALVVGIDELGAIGSVKCTGFVGCDGALMVFVCWGSMS